MKASFETRTDSAGSKSYDAGRNGGKTMRRTTVEDVARAAGVSKTTAASILRSAPNFQVSEATRRRVVSAAQNLDYRRHAVAVALSSGRTNTVGLLVPLTEIEARLPTPHIYRQDIFVAVFQAASRAGLRVTAIPLPDEGVQQWQDFADRSVDGVVMASASDAEFVKKMYATNTPCVEIGSGHGRHLIHPDNEGGMEAGVAHLVQLGHRRIAYWRGEGENYAAVRRHRGFVEATARHRLPLSSTRVTKEGKEIESWLSLPRHQRPTAVMAYNDFQACLVLDMARTIGLQVPDELSVVGFDDNVLAETARPQLTTLHNPLAAQAEAAIALLQTLWSGNEPQLPAPIPTRLVVRGSTAAAPADI